MPGCGSLVELAPGSIRETAPASPAQLIEPKPGSMESSREIPKLIRPAGSLLAQNGPRDTNRLLSISGDGEYAPLEVGYSRAWHL